jgi:hypothetical protein
MAAASSPAWRMLNASMIWVTPRNNATNPIQNKIRSDRWTWTYTRSDPIPNSFDLVAAVLDAWRDPL